MNRREFIASGGALIVSFALPAWGQKLPGALDKEPLLDAWLRIAADGRITVFTGGRRHVVSDSLYRHYEQLLPAAPRCAFVEDGAVLVEDESGWHHVGTLESETLQHDFGIAS